MNNFTFRVKYCKYKHGRMMRLKKQEEIQIDSVQYVYDKDFEKQWKSYYFSLVKRELHQLVRDGGHYEENGDICS